MISLDDAVAAVKAEVEESLKQEVQAMFIALTQNLDRGVIESRFKTGVRAAREAEAIALRLLPGCLAEVT